MKRLILLRHAKSSWDSPAARDFDRPLAPRGERDAPKMGKAFRATGLALDLVVSSPAARAKQTAALFLEAVRHDGKPEYDERIYDATARDLLAVVTGLASRAENVLLVGHNPGFEDLLGLLCGSAGAPARFRVPTAMLACVDLDGDWSSAGAGRGTLSWMLIPKVL